MSFYDRQPDADGAYENEQDRRNQDEAAVKLAEYFSKKANDPCAFHRFGRFDYIDWWAERKDHMIAVAEIKCREHATTTYPTVWLAVRKWLALRMAMVGLGVKGLFAVRFTDGLFYIPINEVDASRHIWAGCSRDRAVNSRNTKEPIIEVPIEDLHRVPE